MENEREKLIEKYSYYFNDSKNFVTEYFDNFKEMDNILKMIFESIKKDIKNYNVIYNECCIMIENKKTKERYKISIEF
jgi:hypothetical protein